MKSRRNKTIDLPLEKGQEYLSHCLQVTEPQKREDILDRILLGDTFETLPLLPKESVDLMIADPPYNLYKDFHGSSFSAMPNAEYAAYTERWIQAVKPLLKPNASVYVCCDWQSSPVVGFTLQRHFKVRNRITWQREKGRGARRNWKNSMEDIWFATVGEDYTFHLGDVMQRRRVIAPYRQDGRPRGWEETEQGSFRNTHPSNFWDDISVPFWSMAENTPHPAQKPEKLLAKLILASSSKWDLVLDPFGGSGSTAVTTKKLDRHFISIEQNPQYCVWAQVRLERAEEDRTIQGYADGVFWERNTVTFQKKRRRG